MEVLVEILARRSDLLSGFLIHWVCDLRLKLDNTQNFQELQAQLEGTENRINTERNRFNETVQDYNSYIAMFPQVFIARMFGFAPKAYFKAAAGSEKAPEVKF